MDPLKIPITYDLRLSIQINLPPRTQTTSPHLRLSIQINLPPRTQTTSPHLRLSIQINLPPRTQTTSPHLRLSIQINLPPRTQTTSPHLRLSIQINLPPRTQTTSPHLRLSIQINCLHPPHTMAEWISKQEMHWIQIQETKFPETSLIWIRPNLVGRGHRPRAASRQRADLSQPVDSRFQQDRHPQHKWTF